MKKIIKNNYKIIIGILIGITISLTSVYAVDAYIESKKVSYENKYTDKNNTQDAIDDLYERSGIHQEKWTDSILNGADPVLKDPLIPVEIKPNGDVYYANLNSEWYNYSEKRWANAVILVDNPSNTNYKVGDHILESDIESYFVWIPRYKYRIWDLGNYDKAIDVSTLSNKSDTDFDAKTYWQLFNKSRTIEIVFENKDTQKSTTQQVGAFYTHPAFTLGTKELNGIWIGKFETGYKGATDTTSAEVNDENKDKVIIKPDVYSWRGNMLKNMFLTSYNYKRELDSHMLKNTEWGAVAYLSHSVYGINTEVRLNNNSDYKTGYSAAFNTNQSKQPGDSGNGKEDTQGWNTETGFLASTTGNISGAYDMSGGACEYVAACIEGFGDTSGFQISEITDYMNKGYIDRYDKDSNIETYYKRILGDATGEMGPFYADYSANNGTGMNRVNTWYADSADFVSSQPIYNYTWFRRSGGIDYGAGSGIFSFSWTTGEVRTTSGSRLALDI